LSCASQSVLSLATLLLYSLPQASRQDTMRPWGGGGSRAGQGRGVQVWVWVGRGWAWDVALAGTPGVGHAS
jgi:hypothetical protein